MQRVTTNRKNYAPRRARPRHAWLYALPDGQLPAAITCNGVRYDLVRTFKHDFFAATGLYSGPAGLTVLKVGRVTPIFGVPIAPLSRLMARHEMRLYHAMRGSTGVPQLIGPVGQTGFLHAFVPGHDLGRKEAVSDTFFDELIALVRDMHARHIAYVDLNKRQNILVGDDGRPCLVDFQISLHLPPVGWRRLPPVRWFLSRFQQADYYHCLKHKRRLRPDLLTPEEKARVERLSVWIRLHRVLSRPITAMRRRTLQRLARSETADVAGSSAK